MCVSHINLLLSCFLLSKSPKCEKTLTKYKYFCIIVIKCIFHRKEQHYG
nr:MAG TPA: hypothetical protein [Caudoviricetes sp.]